MTHSLHTGRTPGAVHVEPVVQDGVCGTCPTMALFTCRSHDWLDVGVGGPGKALAVGQGGRLPLASPGQPADKPSGFSGF